MFLKAKIQRMAQVAINIKQKQNQNIKFNTKKANS